LSISVDDVNEVLEVLHWTGEAPAAATDEDGLKAVFCNELLLVLWSSKKAAVGLNEQLAMSHAQRMSEF
jgi:hypothetical protein